VSHYVVIATSNAEVAMLNFFEVLARLGQSFDPLRSSRYKDLEVRALEDAEQYFRSNPELAEIRLHTVSARLREDLSALSTGF
jgi:hypothetical protein